MPSEFYDPHRRNFIKNAALAIGGTLLAGPVFAKPILSLEKKEEEVSPDEDLM